MCPAGLFFFWSGLGLKTKAVARRGINQLDLTDLMWTRNVCLICIYILLNYAFQISNEDSFLAFLQPAATRLKVFLLSSSCLDSFIKN